MMFREAKLVALALFHTFLLAICAANGNQTCRPSSCGEIQNISNPFRLKGDPFGCGDHFYELVCENNRTMVNGREGEKYYVADINYDHSTIRVVDPGVEKGNCFSTPLHSLTVYQFDNVYDSAYYLNPYEATNTTLLMNCEQPISDGNYIHITPCNGSNVTSSSSQAYVYALVGDLYMEVGEIKYSCTILRTIATRFLKHDNLSMSDLQEMLLLGLELSFLSFRCKSECEVKGLVCDVNYGSHTVQCSRMGNVYFYSFMYLFCFASISPL